jgi:hypothetical protein
MARRSVILQSGHCSSGQYFGGQLRGTSFQGSSLSLRTSPGRPEHALAQDVAHDLGGAALDGVGPHPQEHLAHVGRAHADQVGADHGVAGREQHAVVAQQVHAEVVDPLVLLGVGQLATEPSGPGVPARRTLRGPLVGHGEAPPCGCSSRRAGRAGRAHGGGVPLPALLPDLDGLGDRARRRGG